jgi:hypothetical protein
MRFLVFAACVALLTLLVSTSEAVPFMSPEAIAQRMAKKARREARAAQEEAEAQYRSEPSCGKACTVDEECSGGADACTWCDTESGPQGVCTQFGGVGLVRQEPLNTRDPVPLN